MKLLLIPPQKKERKFSPKVNKCKIPKAKLYKVALREACAELVMEGNYNNYASARDKMIRKAKQLLTNKPQ